MKKIIYIGNHLKSANPTTLNLLSELLMAKGFHVKIYSNQSSRIMRLMHMCWGVLSNLKASYILIDTYSTVNFYYALVISQLARCFSIPYVPILHGGNLPKRLQNNPKLSKFIFKNAYVNIAPSSYLLEEFQRKGFQTRFIPNAIELKKYSFQNYVFQEPKLLWVRAFDAIYNPSMAVLVLELLKSTYPNATLCMVGADKDGSLKKVKEIALKKGLINSIEFTGYLSKEAWIEKSKDFNIFINTTNIDNTPVSVLEAMALGLPVISTKVGGISYLIDDNETGLLVEKKNVQQMTSKIIELFKNEEKAIAISKNARKLVESFDSGKVQQQWNEILK
ncbi:glycosyltransferase family 4 protein [Lutibacter holmesii]|uniref:Glycosyltransferase family 4 protein n=1 Tax=Lutibacter holmesii TaxID=1137985 RepID=A0ABW3WSE3_9FLAO